MELYVSDLDGTLLNSDKEISDYSKTELNKLIDNGVNFTIATARTSATVVDMLEGLNIKLPIALMNGVLIYDIKENNYIKVEEIPRAIVTQALKIFEQYNKSVLVYGIKQNHLWVYHKSLTNEMEVSYYKERCDKPLKTFKKIDSYDEILEDVRVINFVTLGKSEISKEIYEKLRNIKGLTANCYEDIYEEGAYFVDAYSDKASKANAIKYLSSYVNHSRIITFGDNVNDIPMFAISQECYAVENAVEDLKRIATGVIENNNDDAVAKFMKKRFSEKTT